MELIAPAGNLAALKAAVLAGATALRGGAGLVTIASGDPEVQAQLLALRPELMVTGRGEPPVPAATALVVGPGLTRADVVDYLAALPEILRRFREDVQACASPHLGRVPLAYREAFARLS